MAKKYMVQKMGLFGVETGYGDTLKKAMKRGQIYKHLTWREDWRAWTVRNGEIVEIRPGGQAR